MRKLSVLILIFLMSSNIAMANCSYNGKSYPGGTKIGPYVCSDGKWVKR